MKRIILGVSVLLMLVQNLFGYTYEEYNQVSLKAKEKYVHNVILCERDTHFRATIGDIRECKNVIEQINSFKNKTKQQIKYLGESFYNLAKLYEDSPKYKDYKLAIKMYEKSIAVGYDEYSKGKVRVNLGFLYYYGKGASKNYIKSYNLWKDALINGSSVAQNNLEILCKESPWACK